MRSTSRNDKKPQQQYLEENSDLDLEEDIENQKLSQVSIDMVVKEETQNERKILSAKDAQKKQLAKLLYEQQQNAFALKNNKSVTGKERLDFLLKQTEFFTQFILQSQGSKGNAALQKDAEFQKMQKSAMEQVKFFGQGNKDRSQNSASKRKKKSRVYGGDDNMDSDEEEAVVLTRLEVQPSILKGGELRDYQLTSLNWLISLYETGINGILADEMGLGKTIQTIAFLAFLKQHKKVNNYFLIIVPKTVISNWKQEFKKWLPCCRVLNLIATKLEREEILKNQMKPGNFDVVLTSFEGVRLCMGALLKYKWEYIIVDEAHKLKNEESQISQKLRILDSRYRLLLTGTPLQNNLHELWSLLNFLLPEIFASSTDFDEWFNLGGTSTDVEISDKDKEDRNKKVIEQLHRILRPFLLRRLKREVEKQLKPKVEIHVSVGITELQKQIYRSLLKQSKLEKGNSVTYYKNILIQLRKVCNHPYLFHDMEPEDAPELGEHIITSSGKMIFLDALCKKAKADGNQVLLFSGFTSMLDILEDFCAYRQLKYCRLDGNTDLSERERQINLFVEPGSEINIFLISTRAGGLGLNLMTANIVVLYDSDWNPQMDLQAMDRAHRIGQTKVVQVFRLITPNTMEVKMIERQTLKLKLDNMIIQKGRVAPKNQGFQKEEMMDMVNYGADAIFQVGDNLNDKDIDTLIREGEEKALALQQKAAQVSKEKMNMIDFEMNSMNLYNFEDVDYAKQRRDEENLKLNEFVRQMITEDTTARGGRRKMIKQNLSEASLCPKIFQGRNVGISEETKKKKLQIVQDYRFFPKPERLKLLINKEIDSKYSGYFQGIEFVEFTEEEKIEKDLLLSRGFQNWDRRDYQKFVQAIELFPKNDTESITRHIGTKTEDEIKKYQEVFYANCHKLADCDKIQKLLSKSDAHHNFIKLAPQLIRQKVTSYEMPLDEMQLNPLQKSKYFSKEADIVLLCLTHEMGYGNWNAIKHAIRRDTRVRFDHLFMSRSEMELSKRVDILVKSIEKEMEQATTAKPNRNCNDDIEMQDGTDEALNNEEPVSSSQEDDQEDSDEDIRLGATAPQNHQYTGEKRSYQAAQAAQDDNDDEDLGGDNFEGLEEMAAQGLKKLNFQ